MWQGGIGLDQHLRVLYLFQQRCSGTGAKTVHINIHDSQRWCDQRCIRVIVEGDNRNVLRNAQAELTDCLDDADGDKAVKAQNAVGGSGSRRSSVVCWMISSRLEEVGMT